MENKKPWEIAAEQEEEVSSKKPWEIAAEQEQESEPLKKKVSSETTSGAFVPTPLNPTRGTSTSQLGSGGLVSLGEIGNLGQNKVVETPKEAPKPSVNKNKFEPTIADVNKKITDITLKQKFPEYGEFKSFAEASKQAIGEEQKQIQLDAENRSKERRLKTIPAELEQLNKEKNELLLKKDYDSMKKLAAIDAVTKRYDKLLKENEPKSYADLNNLNKDVIKGMEDEVHQYINLPENKYIKDKIALRGLTDIETNDILLKATEQKTKPLIADLKQLTNEGIVDIAKQRMEMSKSINAKQEELKNIGVEIGKIEESELDKKGFKELNVQINKERANLDKLKPSITAIESDVKLINKERSQIESEIKQFDSKINGNQWLGTKQELKKYNQLFSDYNVLVSKEKELYSTPELAEYNKQVGILKSLQETKNGLVKGLQGTKYSELVAKYDLTRNDLNNIITKYGETDSPEINQKLNQYFALANQLDKTTEKYEVARGRLVSLDELDRAKKEIENDPNYATDFGARALNSIADFGKGLAAFPFTFAASLHSDGGYHYSDAISDAIQGKGMEKGFLVNKNKSLINPETGKANWGVVPIINSIGDNLGTLLGFALTGRYLTPIVAGEVSGASSTIMEAQKATEIAKAYTTIIPAYMSSYSGALDEAKELGFKGKGAFLYANAIGFLNGVSEMILPDQDLVFGKGVKTKMLKDFIENYSKNSATAVKDLTKEFVKNGLGGASEEWIVMLGETAASSLGHLADSDIKAKIPTIDEIATTGVSSFVLESGMGMIGQYSENKTLNRLGKLEFAKDFENGKLILDGLKERGAIPDDKYNKLVSDIQKYQSVLGQVPDGISDLKKVAIIEKMLEIKAIKANQPKEKSEVFEKIANKKINEIQSQIETIIDDKDFDKNEEKRFRSEMEQLVQMLNEEAKSKPKKETQLQKFTSPTEDNYGSINRNDGKGIVTLTKEEYLNELQGKITTLESSIDAIDSEQSKAVVYEQVNELNKEKAEILKREIKQENEIDVKKVKYRIAELNNELEQNRISLEKGEMTNRSSKDIKAEISELEKTLPIEVKNETGNTDNNIPNQVESPQQEINITPIEVIAGEEQDNADGGVAKVVQGDGQTLLDRKKELEKERDGLSIELYPLIIDPTEEEAKRMAENEEKNKVAQKRLSEIDNEIEEIDNKLKPNLPQEKAVGENVEVVTPKENEALRDVESTANYFDQNTRSTQDSKYNPDLSGEGEMALREQESRLLELGADRIQAHGLAKGSIGQQFKDLLNILTKGLDSRGGGQLYTAPLVLSNDVRAGGSALGTGGGTAYIDGGFIILARAGVNEIRSIDDIGGVLVNQAVADSLPELVERLKKSFPNISIESYSNASKAVESLLSKEQTSSGIKEQEVKVNTPDKVQEEVVDGSKSGYNPKFKTANKVLGEETTIEMPNGETREAEYMVVESDDILASHNESSFNDTIGFPKTKDGRNANSRNYKGDKSAQLKVDDNAKNLKPSIVISDTATTDGGVPIISQEGIVVSGNGRTMAIKLSQKIALEKYQAYKADLLKRAAKFGLDPNEVAKMKNPILVKVDKNIKDYSVKTFDEYNGKFQKEESPIDKAIKRSSIIQNDEKLKDRILSIIGRHETMSDLFDNKADRKELFDFLVANDIILKQETPKYLQENGEFTPDGKDLINDVLIATILSPETLEATSNVKAFRNKIINALPVLTVNYKLGNNSLETEINEAILLQSKIATMGSQEEFWRHLKQLGMFETANPNTVIINRMINNGAINFKKFIVTYNKSMEVDENNLFGGDQVLTKQQVIDNLKQSNLNENEKQVIANLEDLYAANEEKRPSGNAKMVGGNEAKERVTQPTATPETKAAIEVYNKLKENNDTTTRKEYKALPESIKRVLDNIVNINKQLEQNKLITKKGNCP